MGKKRNVEKMISSKDDFFKDIETIKNEENSISNVIKNSMFEYGSYIIEERAIPNMLDGLKPVQRRSLYAIKAGNMIGSKHYKLARVVGDIIGKYHPHGDSSVVGTIVQMVNEWKNNFPLLMGQGNWGSISGDKNAAMRYIEVKLDENISNLIFQDIEKDNVISWTKNYDETLEEPRILPMKYPFHLINGASGIAYAMASEIPSYNIKEITKLFIYLIENKFYEKDFNKENHKENILNIIKSVDFPTGTNIYFEKNKSTIEDTIFNSSFSLRMRASYELKEDKKEIVLYNIPINIKTDKLKEEITNLRKTYKLTANKRKVQKDPTEILNIIDVPLIIPEKDDATIILNFKKDSDLTSELAKLFKYTKLDKSFNANIRVINENGIPIEVSMFDNIIKFLYFRQHVVLNSSIYDIKKLKERIHILKGLHIALKNIDEIIRIIKSNKNSEEAMNELKVKYQLSEIQTKSILEMKLSRLTGLEKEKIEKELKEKEDLKLEKEKIISTSDNIFQYIKEDYENLLNTKMIKTKKRKSNILKDIKKFNNEDLIKDKEVILMLMNDQTISYIDSNKFKLKNRGTKSKDTKVNTGFEDMNLEIAEKCNLKDEILLISNYGKAFKIKAYKISTKQNYIGNIIKLEEGEEIISISKYNKELKQYILITKKGKIKGINSSILKSITENRSTTIVTLDKEDVVNGFRYFENKEKEYVLILTSDGKVLKFPTKQIGILKGGNTKGSRGVDLNPNTEVIKMIVSEKETDVFIVCSNIGKAKKTNINNIQTKKRGQKPIIFFNQDKNNGNVIGADLIENEKKEALLLLTNKGNVSYIKISDFNTVNRIAKGAIKILNLDNKDKLKIVKKVELEDK